MTSLITGRVSPLQPVFSDFNQFFDTLQRDIFGKSNWPNWVERSSYPKVDIRDLEKSLEIRATVPGLKTKDVTVQYDHSSDMLVLKGASKNKDENSKGTFIVKEIHSSQFRRFFSIPSDQYNVSAISASAEDGILTITIPKKEVLEDKVEISNIEIK